MVLKYASSVLRPFERQLALKLRLRPDFGQAGMPPLPIIGSPDIAKKIFTHRSFFARPTHVFEDEPNDPSPDNEMLEHIGDAVLGLIVTDLLRDMYAHLRVGPATKIRALVVGNATLAHISQSYRLPERLITHPAQAISLRVSPNIQADLFESYVGGLYEDQGLSEVKQWLNKLLKPYVDEAYRIIRTAHGLPEAYLSPGYTSTSDTDSTPSPPTSPFLIVPSVPSIPSSASSYATVGHLALFNQHVQKHRLCVEWVFSDIRTAEAHSTPMWRAEAKLEDEFLALGTGSTKKAAKNAAAKEGLPKLGVYVADIDNLA